MKLLKKLKRAKAPAETKLARITTKTVEQHRREILDSAKKFKYPVQYEKHRLVINAIFVGLAFVVVFFAVILWRIYKDDDAGLFIYKLSQVIPFQAGQIEDQPILLSDYLAYYRSSLHYYHNKEHKKYKSELETKILANYKQEAFASAAKIAYAKKLAKQNNITITQAELDKELEKRLGYGGVKISEETLNDIIKDYYGLAKKEYIEVFLKYPLILRKVHMLTDQQSNQTKQAISKALANDNKIGLIKVKDLFVNDGVEFFDSGPVRYGINDSGHSDIAAGLKINQISEPFVSRDLSSYNFIQLIAKDENQLHYHMITIPMKQLETQLRQLKEQQKIKKYIK